MMLLQRQPAEHVIATCEPWPSQGNNMAAKTECLVCSHCGSENTPTREICFKCREPLHLEDGHAPPLPSVLEFAAEPAPWAARVWHEVSAPGRIMLPDGSPGPEIVVREVGNDSLVFDSDKGYQPSEGLTLEFNLEGRKLHVQGTARRTARTLAMEMPFATTVDLVEPGE